VRKRFGAGLGAGPSPCEPACSRLTAGVHRVARRCCNMAACGACASGYADNRIRQPEAADASALTVVHDRFALPRPNAAMDTRAAESGHGQPCPPRAGARRVPPGNRAHRPAGVASGRRFYDGAIKSHDRLTLRSGTAWPCSDNKRITWPHAAHPATHTFDERRGFRRRVR
jgi:hypothetical protein